MATMLAIKGNKTTTGGEVLEGDENFSDENGALAKDGGLASCGRCGHNGPMLGTAKAWGLTGSTAAVKDNDIVACQCPRGTNRVIARSEYYDDENSTSSASQSGRPIGSVGADD